MSAPRTFRTAISGLGFGQAAYIPILRSFPEIELVAVAARRLEKAEEVARRHGIAVHASSTEALLAEGLDLVCLALPPMASARAVEASLKAGPALLTEKPLALNFGELGEVSRMAAGPRPLGALVNFSFLELAVFQRLKAEIDAGRIGRLRRIDMRWQNESFAHRRHIWNWKTDRAQGGGVLTSLGSHVVYMLEYLFEPIAEIRAVLSAARTAAFAPPGAVPAVDSVRAECRLMSGAIATVTLDNALAGADGHSWEVEGEDGTLILERVGPGIMTNFVLRLRAPSGTETVLAADQHSDEVGGRLPPLRTLVSRMLDHMTGRRPIADNASLLAGCRAQELLDAIEAADHAGGWIGCRS